MVPLIHGFCALDGLVKTAAGGSDACSTTLHAPCPGFKCWAVSWAQVTPSAAANVQNGMLITI